jgi:CDP-4-dehydro-6-deoxyglucose reductase, E1
MAKRALLIGASGLLGGALQRVLEAKGWDVTGTAATRSREGLHRLDLGDTAAADDLIREVAPEVVFLAAAFTRVDGCEQEPEKARRINTLGPQACARACKAVDALLVFYSSDYVFDGVNGPYGERDLPHPVSVYGQTKLEAERLIEESGVDALIIRTTWVYGWERTSKNFAMQVWQQLSSGERMRVASDQVSTPTLVDSLAEVSLRLVELGLGGTVHVAGRDRLSRVEFAQRLAAAFALDGSNIEPVPTRELGQRAHRPLHAGLRTERLQGLLGTEAMSLDESLKRLRRQWRAETHVPAGGARRGSAESLKGEILEKVRQYHQVAHYDGAFQAFSSRIPYAGRVYGESELINLVDASLDFWLTLGPWGDRFEQMLRQRLGVRDVALVNSGSSANLVALTVLTSPQLDAPLRAGDEVITPAATFPTTMAPLLQNRLTPVLVDCEIGTYNLDATLVEEAVTSKTRAIMVPHTLGNPCDLDKLTAIAARHHLYLIEDSCDALGSRYDGKAVGTFGDLATISFYPAHHITMGEGGAVISNKARYGRIVRSVRDWGRDCWCAPGESNTCGRRFGWKLGALPEGYDHKYTYSHIGYNLKPTDLQAAIGVAQLGRLDDFIARRRANFMTLYAGLKPFEDGLILPRWDARAEPSWFGFPITVRADVSRRALVQWLEDANIETRDVFAGNILRQPAYMDALVRVHGELRNTDRVMRDTFFIGVYPGLNETMLEFVIERFNAFFKERIKSSA